MLPKHPTSSRLASHVVGRFQPVVFCGRRRFYSNLHLKRWIGRRFWTDCTEMLSIVTAHAPGQRQHSHRRRQPAWWVGSMCGTEWCPSGPPQGAFCGVSHAVQQHGNNSIAQSVQPNGISGLSGKILPRLCQLTVHGLPHRQFDALSSATPIPNRPSVFTGLTLLQGTIQWHSGGSTFSSVGTHTEGSSGETFFHRVMGLFSQLRSSQEVGGILCSPPTIAPSLLCRAASNSSSFWSISALDRSSVPNSTSAKEGPMEY